MTRIDFYILQDVELDAMHRFACRLATKAMANGNEVHIHASDSDTAQAVDELLWIYPDQRFVPHSVITEQSAQAAQADPVNIGWEEPKHIDDVLINISGDVPGFFGRFDRVAEIVVRSTRDAGRDRYKFYRDRGFPLFHHELDDWETS
jgi:DNA polymerase-3 subunit chi